MNNLKMRTNKKSQMEILGLAFLFVILIFAFLFFISLNSETSTKDTLNEYIEPKIASAFTDMILHTTVRCGSGERTIRELFINCMSYNDPNIRDHCMIDQNLFDDLGEYYYNPDSENFINEDSCYIVKGFIELAENITLKKWAKANYVEAYIIQNNQGDVLDNLDNAFESVFGEPINYSIPELGIPTCYYDPNGRIRSYRSRWQPLPLLTNGNVVLMTGICH